LLELRFKNVIKESYLFSDPSSDIGHHTVRSRAAAAAAAAAAANCVYRRRMRTGGRRGSVAARLVLLTAGQAIVRQYFITAVPVTGYLLPVI